MSDELVEAADGLVGTEETRTRSWSNEVARALGARLLPTLASGHLLVEPADLARLRAACDLGLENAARAAAAGGLGEEYVRHRVGNVRAASVLAGRRGAGVLIG